MTSQQQISDCFCAHLQKRAPTEITVHPHTDLTQELGLDSIQLMELTLELEDEFDISIPLDTLTGVRTPWQLSQAISKLLEAENGAL